MGNIFRFGSPVVLFLEKIGKLLFLNLIWLVCLIPVVTFGPATTAMNYVVLKLARDDDVSVAKDFFHSFKVNMKQGIVLTLLTFLGAALLYVEFVCCSIMEGTIRTVLIIVFVVLALVYIAVFAYTFALQAQFDNTVRQTMKNGFLLSIRNFGCTVRILLLLSVPIVIGLLFPEFQMRTLPLWIFLAPAIIAWLCAKQLNQVFLPYIRSDENDLE